MGYIKQYWLFFGSLFLGIVLWAVLFMFLPLEATEVVKWDMVMFITFSYLAVVLGFLSFKFNLHSPKKVRFNINKFLKILLAIITISYLLRWFDLLYIRELSFTNRVKVNRIISDTNYGRSNILLIIASILKSTYFFPIVIIVASKLKANKYLVIASYIVLAFPLLEAVLKGTRKPAFEIFLITVLLLVVYNSHRLSFKNMTKLILVFLVLITISLTILVQREKAPNTDNTSFYNEILSSRYNDMLKPKPFVEDYLNDETKPDFLKLYALIFLQTGQYITHGVFEFNHIIERKDLPITYGTYTFVTIPKFINKTGFFKKITYSNPSPRKYVYLTTFGGLYIDFRWATLGIMFLFGTLQKYIYQKSKQSFIYAPILIYFLIINVFLLVINYISGAGIYPILSFFFLLLVFRLLGDNIYEKGINT